MASEASKRKVTNKEKGTDKFLSSRRGMRGATGYNSSKRQDIKISSKKEVEKETVEMKHLENFQSFCNK